MGHASSCLEGCFGWEHPEKITLKYFPIPGRAEPIRLALVLGGLQFHDHRLSGEDWRGKYKRTMLFGQVPVLELQKKRRLTQTKAILRYVGRFAKGLHGKHLYPSDPWLGAKVDEIVDAFDDLWILLAPSYRIDDQPLKEHVRQQIFEPGGEGAPLLDAFEAILAKSYNGFAVPEAGLTVADLVYFGFLNSIRSGLVEGLGPGLFADLGYKRIVAHKEMMARIPAIERYYKDKDLLFYEVFRPCK
mmetsp:Transcript_13515/g.29670  ORF Transcript_13515/g.29670 Transcript_13515/m.29670 type:complete len:245 (-) Transcript_13515:24-758(-)